MPLAAVEEALLHPTALDVVLDLIEGGVTFALGTLGESTQVVGAAAFAVDQLQHLRLMGQVDAAGIELLLGVQQQLAAQLALLYTEVELLLELRARAASNTITANTKVTSSNLTVNNDQVGLITCTDQQPSHTLHQLVVGEGGEQGHCGNVIGRVRKGRTFQSLFLTCSSMYCEVAKQDRAENMMCVTRTGPPRMPSTIITHSSTRLSNFHWCSSFCWSQL